MSLMMLAAILVFVRFRRRRFILPALLSSIVVAGVLWASFGDYVSNAYEAKDKSRTVREDDFTNTVTHLPEMLVRNPIGFRFDSGRDDDFDFGTNFTIGNALRTGGATAFLGYTVSLIVAFACSATALLVAKDLSVQDTVVFSSVIVLLPFIVQRTVVWDSALFAFLFSPSLIDVLRGRFRQDVLRSA